ncbi:MAG: hypothetical protein EOO99_02150 [Pedobacter sp.]|nr:MAG: hypothetical protein EOO99_02150 [Pedobacter sp.]
MAIYRFRISFEDYDDIVREIDIKTNQTFEDLHRAFHKSTGYDADKSSSFYVSTDNWIKGEEIAHMPNQRKVDNGVKIMANCKISTFIEDPHQKFYYIYNFDRPFDLHVELIKIILENDPQIDYPHLVKKVGEAPKIFDKNNFNAATAAAASTTSDFDFLNEMDFVAEDADELEAMQNSGISSDVNHDEEEEQDEDEFGSEADGDDYDDYGSGQLDEDY